MVAGAAALYWATPREIDRLKIEALSTGLNAGDLHKYSELAAHGDKEAVELLVEHYSRDGGPALLHWLLVAGDLGDRRAKAYAVSTAREIEGCSLTRDVEVKSYLTKWCDIASVCFFDQLMDCEQSQAGQPATR